MHACMDTLSPCCPSACVWGEWVVLRAQEVASGCVRVCVCSRTLTPPSLTQVHSGPEARKPPSGGSEVLPPPIRTRKGSGGSPCSSSSGLYRRGSEHLTWLTTHSHFLQKEGRKETPLPKDDPKYSARRKDPPASPSQHSTAPVRPGPPAWPSGHSTFYTVPASPTGPVSLPQRPYLATFTCPQRLVL